MTPAVFGFFDGVQDRFERLVHNCLLVAGGFLAGYLLGGAAAWATNRYVLRRKRPDQKLPDTVTQMARLVGGVIGALIVALLVFVGGLGGGPGRGAGSGEGNPEPNTPSEKNARPKVETPDARPKIDSPRPPDTKPADAVVVVTILGGDDVHEGRFYLIGDDRTPKTFEEFKDAVATRKAREPGKLELLVAFPPKNVLPLDHPAVTRVIKWAKEDARIKVGFAEDR